MHMQGSNIIQTFPKTVKGEPVSPMSRSKQGYITLSPSKSKLKDKSSNQGSQIRNKQVYGSTSGIRPSDSYRYIPKENQEDSVLATRVQKPFKPIPKFAAYDLIIRDPNDTSSRISGEVSKSRKTKISITKASHLSEGRRFGEEQK